MKFQKPKLFKLGNKGLAHYVLPLFVVLAVAIGGTVALVASHADSSGCGRGYKLVNATAAEYNTKYVAHTGTYNGQICRPQSDPRSAVAPGGNGNTISQYTKCPSGHSFAYDTNNPDGTGYGAAHWRFQIRMHGTPKQTYYCIPNKTIGHCVDHDGDRRLVACQVVGLPGGDLHTYNFETAFGHSSLCSSEERFYTNCHSNTFFIHKGDPVRYN